MFLMKLNNIMLNANSPDLTSFLAFMFLKNIKYIKLNTKSPDFTSIRLFAFQSARLKSRI